MSSKTSKGRGGGTGSSAKRPTKNVVSAARTTQSSRGTLLAGLAVVLVLAVVVGGIVYNRSQTQALNSGYGSSSTAAVSVDNGIVRVGPADAKVTLDAYEDALCPNCAAFESRFGEQIAQALDEGRFAMRYHMLDFLNQSSASGDYSSRAAGALLCVASDGDGSAFPAFHTAVFDTANQPKERSGSDLSNEQLAAIAKDAGASDAAQQCISSGSSTDTARSASEASQAQLQADGQQVSTPTVLNGKEKIDVFNNQDWVSQVSS